MEECKGLPLALVILGRSMTQKKDVSSWDKLLKDLRKSPTKIPGMESDLFRRLEPSYDRLPNNAVKSCFIYHSMFQEDKLIYNDQLIELWIAEGFLDEFHDIHEARDKGEEIIKTLKHACLLESCGSNDRSYKMHDSIRDLALWLFGECGRKKNKILACNRVQGLWKNSKLKETENLSLSQDFIYEGVRVLDDKWILSVFAFVKSFGFVRK